MTEGNAARSTQGYTDRPWLALYREGQPTDIEPEFDTLLDMWAAAVGRAPHQDAIRYFDAVIGVAELDTFTDALAAALHDLGFGAGDRLAIFTQNDPAFVLGMLAAWKAGGVAVSVNPMYKQRELGHVLHDSGARALLYLDELHPVAAAALPGSAVDIVVSCSARDFQTRDDARALGPQPAAPVDGAHRLTGLLETYAGQSAPPVSLRPDDAAFLVYTSGTTGDPKGAQLTHANFVVNAQNFRDWMQLSPGDTILGLAPLFHITGLVGHGVLSLLLPAPLVLGHRFQADVMVDAIREHRPVFTIGAITAFAALGGVEGVGPDDFASLTRIYSGGAPIAPAVADKLEKTFGGYIHNAYGLTETSSITHIVPPHRRAPVDPRLRRAVHRGSDRRYERAHRRRRRRRGPARRGRGAAHRGPAGRRRLLGTARRDGLVVPRRGAAHR